MPFCSGVNVSQRVVDFFSRMAHHSCSGSTTHGAALAHQPEFASTLDWHMNIMLAMLESDFLVSSKSSKNQPASCCKLSCVAHVGMSQTPCGA